LFSNRWMLWAVGSSFLLLLAVIYTPFLQAFFDTIPLTISDWLVMLPLMLLASVAAELTKAFLRSRNITSPTGVTTGK
jgi:Ca2+-transporting ATPase